ncbi:methyltransferase [Sinisalibacter aestuarii]|uniref:Methyltransferase n=2 Tax=Sinisalibacter aestuarii TaxID=2949426 RepID=A0ABQ5LSP8_9RHOB|nr:methyltransferase [Sinisalibacter aestuarii]
MPLPDPDDVLRTYEAVAQDFARARSRALFERRWLDRALGFAPGREVLDLGCGPGRPIASYLAERRCRMTGVDGAASMCALYQANVPGAVTYHEDMRGLGLGRRYDLILAWDSLFHLAPDDQRGMFATFAAHARPRTVLLFTSGPDAGEVGGQAAGLPVYHASLSPDEYRGLLAQAGFEVLDFVPEDPNCHGHTVWMARYVGG